MANNPSSSIPPSSPVPTSSSATGQYIGLAVALLLVMGALLLWKFHGGGSPPMVSLAAPSSSASALTHPRLLDDVPPPPSSDEVVAVRPEEVGKKKPTGESSGGCGGTCTGTAPPALQADVQARAGRARGCYERAMRQNSELQGALMVTLRIDPAGVVCSAAVSDDSIGSPEVSRCVAGMFRGQKLSSPPSGGCVDMRVPMKFQSRK